MLYHVTNNFNCICDSCFDEFEQWELFPPAFITALPPGECELCGGAS